MDADRFKLLHGPYRPPHCCIGGWLTCAVRGRVKVHAISDAPVQWPMTRQFPSGAGRLMLIVTPDLECAIRTESN